MLPFEKGPSDQQAPTRGYQGILGSSTTGKKT